MENRNKPYYIDYSKSAEKLKKNSLKKQDDELAIFVVKNLKYIIRFDGFDLVNVSYSNYKSKIDEIFKYTVSNGTNNYPLEISLNTANIKATI